MNRSIGSDEKENPKADYTIRMGVGHVGTVVVSANGDITAIMKSGEACSLFIAGAAAAGKSVYNQITGQYVAGTVDQLTDALRGL